MLWNGASFRVTCFRCRSINFSIVLSINDDKLIGRYDLASSGALPPLGRNIALTSFQMSGNSPSVRLALMRQVSGWMIISFPLCNRAGKILSGDLNGWNDSMAHSTFEAVIMSVIVSWVRVVVVLGVIELSKVQFGKCVVSSNSRVSLKVFVMEPSGFFRVEISC